MSRRCVRVALVSVLWPWIAAASEAPFDWSGIAAQDVVEVLTRDPDGDLRETPVWIAVVDERGYVCTNDTRWYANLERDPELELRAGDLVSPFRAEELADPALRERVDEGFRAKYPWGRWLMELFGGDGGKHCLALTPR